ncbi:hypothetical protein [uncultured Phascolarctobacterium sp.]|uniref:hypothetical protein n=1 Tax=uncultured Phascolarctobacterium sp. TaxID=512296 RepID=UPI0025D08A91|nr:hypothetical protein [uncultured Phascolarctobacterium sp.]
MRKDLQTTNSNSLSKIDIFNSPEYKALPVEKQLELAKLMAEKNIEFNAEQQRYLLEHTSSDHDIAAYLNFLDQQNSIDANAKGVTIRYDSHETKTPTGKISSKTTHATASSGCLIPVLGTLLLLATIFAL